MSDNDEDNEGGGGLFGGLLGGGKGGGLFGGLLGGGSGGKPSMMTLLFGMLLMFILPSLFNKQQKTAEGAGAAPPPGDTPAQDDKNNDRMASVFAALAPLMSPSDAPLPNAGALSQKFKTAQISGKAMGKVMDGKELTATERDALKSFEADREADGGRPLELTTREGAIAFMLEPKHKPKPPSSGQP